MNILDKLSALIKFKKDSEFILKRINKLNSNLETLATNIGCVTNQKDDMINWLLIHDSIRLESDCKFSLEIIRGKLKNLRTINKQQEDQKEEITKMFNDTEKEYTKLSMSENELVAQAKSSIKI